VLTDHAGTEECRDIDCDSRLVGDIPYRLDILNCSSRSAIWTDFQTASCNLLRESQRIGIGARAGAGQSDIEHLDTQLFHKVEKLDLVFDGGIRNRRRLQAVAERFIVQ